MCGHSVTFSRSPPWAPLGRAARRFQEDACDKTSGEPGVQTLEESVVVMIHTAETVWIRLYRVQRLQTDFIVFLFSYLTSVTLLHQGKSFVQSYPGG